MVCKRCDDLLAAYKSAVRLYVDAERGCRGLLGDDLQRVRKEVERLRRACRDADEALIGHLRQAHLNLGEKPSPRMRQARP